MIAAAIFMGVSVASLIYIAYELLRFALADSVAEHAEHKRREQMQERMAQANGHPRTGNVTDITYYT